MAIKTFVAPILAFALILGAGNVVDLSTASAASTSTIHRTGAEIVAAVKKREAVNAASWQKSLDKSRHQRKVTSSPTTTLSKPEVAPERNNTAKLPANPAKPVARRLTTSSTTDPNSGQIAGTVNYPDGAGLPTRLISVTAVQTIYHVVSFPDTERTVQPDASGNYSISGLPAGDYTIQFSDGSGTYPLQYLGGAPSAIGGTALHMAAGGSLTASSSVLLSGTNSISGSITDADGNPIHGGVVITAGGSAPLGPEFVAEGVTDASGLFTISDLIPGDYKVGFDDNTSAPWSGAVGLNVQPPYLGQFFNGSPDYAHAEELNLIGATDIRGINAVLTTSPDSLEKQPGEKIAQGNPAEATCNCGEKDPVNAATGEFYDTETALNLPGVGPAINATRTYSSTLSHQDGPFGYGWSTMLASKVQTVAANPNKDGLPLSVNVVQENGSTVPFVLESNGSYVAPQRVLATLAYDPSAKTFTFTRKKTESFTFDAAGDLSYISENHGNEVNFFRDAQGNVNNVTSTGGRALTLTYAGDHITKITDSAGRAESYGYDSDGDLAQVTDPAGRVTSYGYDSAHELTTMTKPNGGVTTNTYNSAGQVTNQTDALNRATRFDYSGTTTTMTQADGSVTSDVFNNDGTLYSRTTGSGTSAAATTTYLYDDNGDVTVKTDPLGNTSYYDYDTNGNVIDFEDPMGRTVTSTYDGLNDVTSVMDADGNKTTNAFDTAGDELTSTSPTGRVTKWTYNLDGTRATAVSGRSKTTTYAYTKTGQLSSTTDPDGQTKTITYDTAGQPITESDSGKRVTSFTYDEAGEKKTQTDARGKTTTYSYDGDGNTISTTDPAGDAVHATYDAADEETSSVDGNGKTTSYTYSPTGALASAKDPLNHTTKYQYDAAGNTTATIDAFGHKTTFTYDLKGNELTSRSQSGRTTTNSYDADGEKIASTDASGNQSTYAYDGEGHETAETDPIGRTDQRIYTADGQLYALNDNNAAFDIYSYDLNGQESQYESISLVDYSFLNVTTYSYDSAGYMNSKTAPGGLHTKYDYNTAGLLNTTTLPDGSTLTNTYDSSGNLTKVHSSRAGSVDDTYSYDAAGRRIGMTDASGANSETWTAGNQLASETNANGKTLSYTYDNAGRLKSIKYPGNHAVSYGYDVADNLTSVTDWSGNATTMTYTADNELSTQVSPNGVTQTVQETPDDQISSLATSRGANKLLEEAYSFDAAGDLTSLSDSGSALPAATTNYTFDGARQLASAGDQDVSSNSIAQIQTLPDGSSTSYNAAEQLTAATSTSSDATTYSYDANGERSDTSSNEENFTYTYSPLGTIDSVTATGDDPYSVAYKSDALGLIASRTSGPSTTHLEWSTATPTPRLMDDGTETYIYGAANAPIEQIDDSTGTPQYFVHDNLGSTRLLTDSAGTVSATYTYDAYGKQTSHSGSKATQILYTGNWTDPTTGLVDLRAREYDPSTAQFLTIDPAVDQTHEPYAYAAANPVQNTDPSGLCGGVATPEVHCSTASDFDPTLKSDPWLLSPQASAISGAFQAPVLSQALSVLQGAYDFASGGLTETIRNHWSPFAACAVNKDGFYYTGGIAALLAPSSVSDDAGAAAARLSEDASRAGGDAEALGAGRILQSDDYTFSDSIVKSHLKTYISGGGRLDRPFMRSGITIDHILESVEPVADPGGLPGGLRYDAPGTFNGSDGVFELVIDPANKRIVHFNFVSSK